MSSASNKLRIATYNIHKCRGMDARVRPERIAEVIAGLDADVIALQEVVRGKQDADQLRVIARSLRGFHYCFGETRKIGGADYGNAILSRFPIAAHQHYDITASWREPRGCLRADLEIKGKKKLLLRLFNAHLGTGYIERRRQAQILVDRKMLGNPKFAGNRIMLGDFNEWTPGLTTKLLGAHLKSADLRPYMRRVKTYPGMLPFMHLDHIYFDPVFELSNITLCRTKLAKVASDHLPLVAEFSVNAA
ncbi:MAG: Endonuclease/exonuclease/phosphatase [Acidobacteriales bacterium]|nr:Endonuclease/exonuclease/phosphatase [Terriglobales bacterium]